MYYIHLVINFVCMRSEWFSFWLWFHFSNFSDCVMLLFENKQHLQSYNTQSSKQREIFAFKEMHLNLHLKGQTVGYYSRVSVGYFELKHHIHTLGASEIYFTPLCCSFILLLWKGHYTTPLNRVNLLDFAGKDWVRPSDCVCWEEAFSWDGHQGEEPLKRPVFGSPPWFQAAPAGHHGWGTPPTHRHELQRVCWIPDRTSQQGTDRSIWNEPCLSSRLMNWVPDAG